MIRNIPSKTEFNFKHDITLISNENVAKDVKKTTRSTMACLNKPKWILMAKRVEMAIVTNVLQEHDMEYSE